LLWNGPDRNVEWMRSLWEGGKALSEDETQAVDTQRRERHVVTLPPDSPFAEPERWSTRWTVPMTKEELVGLAATYSRVITMDEAARQDYLGSVRHFLDTNEELATKVMIDVPMRCLCWRTTRL
jgi:hypothetical protein